MASSISILASLTKEAHDFLAEQGIAGRAYLIERFVVGKGGHDPADPEQPLSPNENVTSLPQQTFGPKLLLKPSPEYTGVKVSQACARYTGLLDYYEGNGPISNVGLIARVIYSPIVGDPEVGKSFLFAYGNRPLITKVDGDQLVINVTIKT